MMGFDFYIEAQILQSFMFLFLIHSMINFFATRFLNPFSVLMEVNSKIKVKLQIYPALQSTVISLYVKHIQICITAYSFTIVFKIKVIKRYISNSVLYNIVLHSWCVWASIYTSFLRSRLTSVLLG